jgi:hypothetical protein
LEGTVAGAAMKRDTLRSGKSSFDLTEEATHVLRTAPALTIAMYYAGSIPFVVAVLYFWADMSRSAFAGGHLAEASLGIAALFLWMKTWQVVFTERIRAHVAGSTIPSWTASDAIRVFFYQAVIQPSGLFILPLAMTLTVPTCWVYAFYQNVTVFGGRSADLSSLVKKAWKHAQLWPLENHFTAGILSLLGIGAWLNWFFVCLLIPALLKTLFGVESVFSRNPFSMLNTTLLAVVSGLAYLTIDPVAKTAYTLRCFYGESLNSGEDLKVQLKVGSTAQRLAGAILVFALVAAAFVTPTIAQDSAGQISATALDQQIDHVLHQSKYAWRMPRSLDDRSNGGIVSRFLAEAMNLVRSALRSIGNWLERLLRRFFADDKQGGTLGWISSSLLLYVLLAAVLALLAIFLLRVRRRNESVATMRAQAIAQLPDLADENIGAEQHPEDEWIRIAQELVERGEFRLAMRAFYLASLAHLGRRNLIILAKFKSNRDYENELRRRAHTLPELLPVFVGNVSIFERAWYGMYEVDANLVQRFAEDVRRLVTLRSVEAS